MNHKQWCETQKIPCPFGICEICRESWDAAQREERKKHLKKGKDYANRIH